MQRAIGDERASIYAFGERWGPENGIKDKYFDFGKFYNGKRTYENEFKKHLVYAMGSLEETKVWLLFSKDCLYISTDMYDSMCKKYDEIGARLYKLFQNWKTF